MACSNSSGGSCQSSEGCYNSVKDECSSDNKTSISSLLCIKCKVNESIAVTHPSSSSSSGGSDSRRFCSDCFRSNLFGKFKFAVTSNAMISPSDNVLLAFSGGTSSRVALQFVHDMQLKAQTNFDASKDGRSLPVFGVGVAYIDETAATSPADRPITEMELIVSSLAPPQKQFHVVPTENVYSTDDRTGDSLTELLDLVDDITGKEDLQVYLRMRSLQKLALENGYTKIVLGTCASRIACHVLEATVKGQGFSLAADIQYVDARWQIPVVLPLRDCLSEELTMLCSLDSLKSVDAFQKPHSGINGLISSFVKLLREENPSRESTIVRTAGKLTPFCFNRIPEVGDHNGLLAQRRQKKYNLMPNESVPPESFCLVCNSPLKKSNHTRLNSFTIGEPLGRMDLVACPSCQYQILPKDSSSLEHFYSLLPKPMAAQAKDKQGIQKLLREQIQDCLLLDNGDGT